MNSLTKGSPEQELDQAQEQPPFGELELVYQDKYMAVINKPAGLLVHRSYLARRERWFAMQLLRDQLGQHVFPVHRLDRPTSGLLMFALSSPVAALFGELFTTGGVQRGYHAVVRGYAPDEGRLDYPLKEELDKIADKRAKQNKAAQEAITNFVTLERVELPFKVSTQHDTTRYSLVQLTPETG